MVSVLDSGLSGPGSGPGQEDIVLCSRARHASLTVPFNPGIQMGTAKFHAGGNLKWTSILSGEGGGGVEILRDKLQPDRPLGS